MKKTLYDQPTIKVVELKTCYHLLSGSEVKSTLQAEEVEDAW